MDKRKYYDKIHKELADKYSGKPEYIQYLRAMILGNGKDLKEIILHLYNSKDRSLHSKNNPHGRHRPKPFYVELLSFLRTLDEDKLEDILQKTKFDKTV